MKTIEIKGKRRDVVGKKNSKILRKQNHVPCVMYGGKEVIHFSIFNNDFDHLVYTPDVFAIKLDIDGKQYEAILQEKQFHPVTDKVIHADFLEVSNKPVIINLPIVLVGNSIGVKDGGKLRLKRRSLKIKGLIADMPDNLEIDITDIGIGKVLKIGELSFDKLTLLDPAQSMIVAVVSPRVAEAAMTLEEEGTEEEVDTEEDATEEGAEKESSEATEKQTK